MYREQTELRLIGIAFIALVIYIVVQLIFTFLTKIHAVTSVGGIIWIATTFIARSSQLLANVLRNNN